MVDLGGLAIKSALNHALGKYTEIGCDRKGSDSSGADQAAGSAELIRFTEETSRSPLCETSYCHMSFLSLKGEAAILDPTEGAAERPCARNPQH